MGLGSLGLKVSHSDTAEGSYTDITEIIGGSLPKPKMDVWQDKSLDQSGAGIPKKGTGFVDGGQFTLKIAYNATTYALLMGLTGARAPTFWKVKWPLEPGQVTPAQVVFEGILAEGPGGDFPEDGTRIEDEITIEVSKLVTYTAGASE